MTALGTEPITAEQLLEMDERGELIRGVFCPTMVPGFLHGKIIAKLIILLGAVVAPGKLGTIVTADAGVLLSRDPDTVLGPDIAYYSKEKIALDATLPGYTEVPPEIVVEVVSPSDSVTEVHGKAAMWLVGGVQLVWVVWPETKVIEIHHRDRPIVRLQENDTLTGEDILPQFSTPVQDIFDV